MAREAYVHGYDEREHTRLQDQAATLEELLHADTRYPAGSRVLEAGCGVGAQTIALAKHSPDASITAVDLSESSLAEARQRIEAAGATNVVFRHADLLDPPFDDASFDHLFVCFVLEHLSQPVEVLRALGRCLVPGGTITAIEGDHGSAYFSPRSDAADAAIGCLIELQRRAGGDSLIGRELYPLLRRAGYSSVSVSPRMVYVDASRPAFVEGFTKKTFAAMIEGVREPALREGLIDPATFDRGVEDLYRTAEEDGTFCYTFFKAVAVKP